MHAKDKQDEVPDKVETASNQSKIASINPDKAAPGSTSTPMGLEIQDERQFLSFRESLSEVNSTHFSKRELPDGKLEQDSSVQPTIYKVYKRRFVGLIMLALLNAMSAHNATLFTTITTQTSSVFQMSLTKVNWLGNIFGVTFVVVAWFVPLLVEKMAIRWVCIMAGAAMTIGAWLRYAATYTTNSLDTHAEHMAAYSLLLLGSFIISISQPLLLILGPAFSELYFSPKTRMTATMIIAVSNPVGQAVASFLAPTLVPEKATMSDFKTLLLVVASATTLISLVSLAIGNGPPTPASASSEIPRHSAWDGFKVLFGIHTSSKAKVNRQFHTYNKTQPDNQNSNPAYKNSPEYLDFSIDERPGHEDLTRRDRIDFLLLTWLFGTLVGAFSAYAILIEQIYSPYGFNSDQAGYFGIASIIPGLISAGISSPIFDRFLRRSRGPIIKCLGPLLGLTYFGLIWIPKTKNIGAIYVLNIGIGIFSFISLPVALELGADITHKAMTPDSSAAILYLVGNALSVIFLIIMDALRSGSDSSPPFDMTNALIFQGVMTLSASICIVGLKAKQRRPDL
ncbi:uncharacterized protein MELLADRAFT_93403 [Melampsora larici-populina 98AG31]|uniref:Major facilitator superfamily (MFS) profile domain-containing protein n=1 Tax=Melampsora larici-populina (strain 98AG31 / pathotype 3-4-7) TaxID=747676 RepID=F4RA96_MELLP|nr:uncharacterized protein MELLADRAFT_93403 [Melampsora larici-populina 98AG31]EGG10440.1 hypothetical protein MELLADRAFT_93403 [Melampsora larici-populina 98AG31]